MKNFVQLMMVLLLSSCGLEQTGTGLHSGSDGVWRGLSYGKHMSGTWYAAAMDYPDGCDWRADDDSQGCCIVMFADGIPVLKVPTGHTYEVSADPGKVRIRSGHLFTDHTDGTVTVVKKDGEDLFRYDGAEEVVSLEVVGGTVHMLCRPVSGDGFVYRVDGDSAVARDSGKLYGGLDVSDGHVGFCYATRSGCYEVHDGKVSLVAEDEGVEDMIDMCICGGKLCMLTQTEGHSSPTMSTGSGNLFWDYFESLDIVSSCFLDTDSLCVRLRCKDDASDMTEDILWFGDGMFARPRRVTHLLSVVVDSSGYYAAANPSEAHGGLIVTNLVRHDMPDDYYVYGNGCAVVRDGMLYLGLTSGKNGNPVIWKNGVLDTLNVNGPLICLR